MIFTSQNKTARRRAYHLVQVMAWGYTLPEAFAMCKAQEWFGDTLAH
jgi:hypothetical protein